MDNEKITILENKIAWLEKRIDQLDHKAFCHDVRLNNAFENFDSISRFLSKYLILPRIIKFIRYNPVRTWLFRRNLKKLGIQEIRVPRDYVEAMQEYLDSREQLK